MKRLLLAISLLVAASVAAIVQPRPEQAMGAAAKALLTALDAGQQAQIRFPMESEERFNWHFIPRERKGVSLKMMTPAQRDAAFVLLKTGLSEKGFTKAETIRSLEIILKALENGAARRDPENYFFSIFGEPGADKWGWRYEGHHISQNWTIVRGKATATSPAFFGTNPAVVQDGPTKGQRAAARSRSRSEPSRRSPRNSGDRRSSATRRRTTSSRRTHGRLRSRGTLPGIERHDRQTARRTLRRLIEEHVRGAGAGTRGRSSFKDPAEKPDGVSSPGWDRRSLVSGTATTTAFRGRRS
jgi:hypothetical protein